jgi:hypothetical protein
VARKDRERARKRHAIERARRESGVQAEPREERPSANRRPPSRPRTGRPQRGPGQLRKLQIGDVDRRGREFKRNMVLHPRTAMFISLAVIAAAIVGLFRPRLQWVSYLAFSLGFVVFADSRPTWVQAGLWIAVAGICALFAVYLFVSQVL